MQLENQNCNITPLHKKDSRMVETNYRPISILPNLSKIYERMIHSQMSIFFENFLSKYQCGFRERFIWQQYLLVMIQKWKKCLDKGNNCEALLTDLYKVFDCLIVNILIAKLHAYRFELDALRFLYSYLRNRKQSIKINENYSNWQEILFEVP